MQKAYVVIIMPAECCIFHKQRMFGDWSDDDSGSDGDCDECNHKESATEEGPL